MPYIYNRRDIMQECLKSIKLLKEHPEKVNVDRMLINILKMILKLAEYPPKEC